MRDTILNALTVPIFLAVIIAMYVLPGYLVDWIYHSPAWPVVSVVFMWTMGIALLLAGILGVVWILLVVLGLAQVVIQLLDKHWR